MQETPLRTELPARSISGFGLAERRDTGGDSRVELDIPSLNALALRSLRSLFDETEQLFVERVTLRHDGYRRAGTSRRQTIIALLGLHRLAELGVSQPFDLIAIQDAAFRVRSWVKTAGDLGLLIWFAATCFPERLVVVFEEFDLENALAKFQDGRDLNTQGLAWFLAGLAHAALACRETKLEFTDLAADTYRRLIENQGRSGIFGHSGSARFPLGTLSKRYGTFSDQTSAIYSMSMFAKVFEIDEPLESALACANAICALQGDLGQWWFLYDKNTCQVVKRYPVLSPHQDGTAPLALVALAELTGRGFQKAIAKGLSWVGGANELGSDLRDFDQEFIWDSIGTINRLTEFLEAALEYLFPIREVSVKRLRVRHDARPAHFGWLLYALGNSGLPKSTSYAGQSGGGL